MLLFSEIVLPPLGRQCWVEVGVVFVTWRGLGRSRGPWVVRRVVLGVVSQVVRSSSALLLVAHQGLDLLVPLVVIRVSWLVFDVVVGGEDDEPDQQRAQHQHPRRRERDQRRHYQVLDVEVYAQDGEEDDGGAAQDHDLQQGHNQPRQRQASDSTASPDQ